MSGSEQGDYLRMLRIVYVKPKKLEHKIAIRSKYLTKSSDVVYMATKDFVSESKNLIPELAIKISHWIDSCK